MTRGGWRLPGLLALLLQGSCAMLPQPGIDPPAQPLACPLNNGAALSGADYRIEQATLVMHTYRAGWLRSLAHNHVIETDALQGGIRLTHPVDGSTARLCFRPWDLVLDDPDSRAAAGAGFESERDGRAVHATRTRMLGPAVFHSNEHPMVRADVRWQTAQTAAVDVHFRGKVIALEVPVTWQHAGDLIRVTADFEISHRTLGIRPYTAFLGAIAVADPIRIQLRLSARAASSL